MLVYNHFKSLTNLTRNLLFKNTQSYIKQKQIDEISKGYGQGTWDKIKMYSAVFKHIGVEGLKGAKTDLKAFQALK